jgi:retron-type reverse transcriptase
MILEPIYEADFVGFSYGFRPHRSQHKALETHCTWLDIQARRGFAHEHQADLAVDADGGTGRSRRASRAGKRLRRRQSSDISKV